MEESGHYYTVYYTSLAVGFSDEQAYRHALLAQMPDELGWLDAANMHKRETCSLVGFWYFFREYDLRSVAKRITPLDRYNNNEYPLHALVDNNADDFVKRSEFQRRVTLELLRKYTADSVEFGLLLHRLGDTYAHSVMGDEERMYTTTSSGTHSAETWNFNNMGHLKHWHDPDNWILRPDLFFIYLQALYDLLKEKFQETRMRPSQFLLYEELAADYADMLAILERRKVTVRFSNRRGNVEHVFNVHPGTERKMTLLCDEIRHKALEKLGLVLKPYQPETVDKQTFFEFVFEHPELIINDHTLRSTDLESAIRNIATDLYSAENNPDPFRPRAFPDN